MSELRVEVNPHFQRAPDTRGSLSITPPIDEDYWIARVVLFKDQAIQCFPKFFTIGCGFAQEEDWNTNLPLGTPAEELYRHIEHNKKYDEISESMCLEAIRLLQTAVLVDKVTAAALAPDKGGEAGTASTPKKNPSEGKYDAGHADYCVYRDAEKWRGTMKNDKSSGSPERAMSETEVRSGSHTPGPWTAAHSYVGAEWRLFVTAPGKDGFRPWSDADARLIASAPELLEALRGAVLSVEWRADVMHGLNGLDPDPEAHAALDRFARKCRALIAKAEGTAAALEPDKGGEAGTTSTPKENPPEGK